MPKNKVISPCVKSPAAAVGKDRCWWSEAAKIKGQSPTGIEAVNWEAVAVQPCVQEGRMGGGCKEVGRLIWKGMSCNVGERQEIKWRQSIICRKDCPSCITGHKGCSAYKCGCSYPKFLLSQELQSFLTLSSYSTIHLTSLVSAYLSPGIIYSSSSFQISHCCLLFCFWIQQPYYISTD